MAKSAILVPTPGDVLINPVTGQPFSTPPEIKEKGLLIPQRFACTAHARQALKAKAPMEAWAKAMLEVLFHNPRFAKAAGWDRKKGTKATIDGANKALDQMTGMCCFLSSPERKLALELALDPEKLKARVDDRRHRLTPRIITP